MTTVSPKHRAKPVPAAAGQSSPRLQFRAVTDLCPDPRNPRKHSPQQVRAVAKSIEEYGFNTPILIDKNNQIIAGHARHEAARLLGRKSVPVIVLDHLNEIKARAYMLADNKLSDRSSWDEPKLAILLKELSIEIPDLEVIGFETPEIDILIQSLESPQTTDAAEQFILPQGPAISTAGDVWHLDNHRLFCGSALDAAACKDLFGIEKAAAIFTDPPYNVKIDGHVCGNGAVKHREFAMAAGEMSCEQFTDFLLQVFNLGTVYSDPGALIYCCMDWRHISEILAAAKPAKLEPVNVCVWVKDNGGMGSLYRSRHELVFVFRNGKHQHRNNVQLGRFGRNRTNVWNYPSANNFGPNGTKQSLELHPTVKPIAMVADALLDSTKLHDLVFDPFIGSGTTLLACERTGRRCYGIELDPLYVDTTIERWEQLTGHGAIHSNGTSFASLKTARKQPE